MFYMFITAYENGSIETYCHYKPHMMQIPDKNYKVTECEYCHYLKKEISEYQNYDNINKRLFDICINDVKNKITWTDTPVCKYDINYCKHILDPNIIHPLLLKSRDMLYNTFIGIIVLTLGFITLVVFRSIVEWPL